VRFVNLVFDEKVNPQDAVSIDEFGRVAGRLSGSYVSKMSLLVRSEIRRERYIYPAINACNANKIKTIIAKNELEYSLVQAKGNIRCVSTSLPIHFNCPITSRLDKVGRQSIQPGGAIAEFMQLFLRITIKESTIEMEVDAFTIAVEGIYDGCIFPLVRFMQRYPYGFGKNHD